MDGHRGSLTRYATTFVLAVVPLAFFAIFFAYPVAAIFGRALLPRGRFNLSPIGDMLTDPDQRGIAWFTFWQATVSTVLTLLAGLPAAYVTARYRFPGRSLFRALVLVPFVLPTLVVATSFRALLGDGGPLGSLGWREGLAPLFLAHVFFNVAVVVRTVGGYWANLDVRRVEAARVLGASRWRAFREVTWPLLAPSVIAAASIVFLFTFTSFGAVLYLAGPSHGTLEVEIYRQAIDMFDLEAAAALGVIQTVAVVALVTIMGWLERRRAVQQPLVGGVETSRPPRRAREWLLVVGVLSATGLFLLAPLVVLAARSFGTAGGASFGYYRALAHSPDSSALFVPPWEAIRNSITFALVATGIAVAVGGLASWLIARRGRGAATFDVLLMVPLGTSAVMVGFGYLVSLGHLPGDLRTSAALIPIAHAVIAIPFVIRALAPALRSIDPRLREAAAVLGASPGRVWREVDLPIVARALAIAAGFAAAISLGEFGATVFVARPDAPTIPIAISRFLSLPGSANQGQAMALATILMLVTTLVVLLIERVRGRELGTF